MDIGSIASVDDHRVSHVGGSLHPEGPSLDNDAVEPQPLSSLTCGETGWPVDDDGWQLEGYMLERGGQINFVKGMQRQRLFQLLEKLATMLANVLSLRKARVKEKAKETIGRATIVANQATYRGTAPTLPRAKGKEKLRKAPTTGAKPRGRNPAAGSNPYVPSWRNPASKRTWRGSWKPRKRSRPP